MTLEYAELATDVPSATVEPEPVIWVDGHILDREVPFPGLYPLPLLRVECVDEDKLEVLESLFIEAVKRGLKNMDGGQTYDRIIISGDRHDYTDIKH